MPTSISKRDENVLEYFRSKSSVIEKTGTMRCVDEDKENEVRRKC